MLIITDLGIIIYKYNIVRNNEPVHNTMITLKIKPLSLNSAYRGRRFTTPELRQFKLDVSRLLPKIDLPRGKLAMQYIFGVSSKNSDADNLVKSLQDALSECWGFNDKLIYKITIEKIDVKKGEEYISFEINEYK